MFAILVARVLTQSVLSIRMLVPLGYRHIHVGRVVLITAIVPVLVRAFTTVFLVVVRVLLLIVVLSRLSLLLLPLAIGLDLRVDILEALFLHICLALWLSKASVTAQVHGVTVSITILYLINLSSWRCSILSLAWGQDGLLHHHLVLILLVLILEISPFRQDLHSLNILNSRQFLPVIFIAAKCVKIDLLSQSLVLVLDYLKDIVDLFAIEHFLVVHSCNRVEYGPHNLRVVNSTKVVADIETKDNLIKF